MNNIKVQKFFFYIILVIVTVSIDLCINLKKGWDRI